MKKKKSKVRIQEATKEAKRESKFDLAVAKLGVHYYLFDMEQNFVQDVIKGGKNTLIILTNKTLPKTGELAPVEEFMGYKVLVEKYDPKIHGED